VAVDFTYMRNL